MLASKVSRITTHAVQTCRILKCIQENLKYSADVVQVEEAAAGPSRLLVRSYLWHFVNNYHALALKDVWGI